jgi:hypothetical protein
MEASSGNSDAAYPDPHADRGPGLISVQAMNVRNRFQQPSIAEYFSGREHVGNLV